MSLPADLLSQARHLAALDSGRPRQASLRRAVSAAYYALFHHLTDLAAWQTADAFIQLQEARHAADYDLSAQLTRQDTQRSIQQAESALAALKRCRARRPSRPSWLPWRSPSDGTDDHAPAP